MFVPARSRFPTLLWLFAILLGGPALVHGQLPNTRLFAVFPPGARAGESIELKVASGEDLEEISRIRFSHAGIQGTPREADGKPTGTFDVRVAPEVPPGTYEVFVGGYWGLSNPRTFVVGSRPEVIEAEPNSEPAMAMAVEMGTVINGRLDQATDVDCFRFQGRTGSRVILDCRARRIDSRMAPVIEIYDLHGHKLAHTRAARHDATQVFEPPVDGEYVVRLFDETFGGGPEFFYRLTLSEGPYVAFALPPAGLPGATSKFSLYGANLPGGQPTDQRMGDVSLERLDVEISIPSDPATLDVDERIAPVESGMDAFSWRLQSPQGVSNPVRIHLAEAPPALEQEPNNDPSRPQSIAAPCDLGGQFATLDDTDVYTFDVKAGDVWWIEVYGERIDSDVDPMLIVEQVTLDGDGQQKVDRLTVQDDIGVDLAPNAFDTQSDDASFRYVAPADGRCRIILRDRYGETRGDPSLIYRLVVRKEAPDFRLVAVPVPLAPGQTGSTTLRRGDDYTFNVLAFRREGFEGPIDVRAEGLPPGVTTAGTVIGPHQTSAPLVLTTAIDAPETTASIRLVGSAALPSPTLVRALDAANAAFAGASKALADLRKNADAKTHELLQAAEELSKAVTAANASPAEASLRTERDARQQAIEASATAQREALEKLKVAESGLEAMVAAQSQAQAAADAAVRHVERTVRSATVVWGTLNNRPAFSRVSRELPVSVMKEVAPYQIQPQLQRADVRQGGLVLVPVRLERRNGFDGEVQVAINGRPGNAGIDGGNFKFEKDAGEFLLTLFVKENSPPDVYAISLTGQAQVPYRRHPEKADRAKSVLDEQAAVAQAAQEALQKADAANNEAVQNAATAVQKMDEAQQAREKGEAEYASATKGIEEAQAARELAAERAKEAAAAFAVAKESQEDALKSLEADPDNTELHQKKDAAEAGVAAAQASAVQADAEADQAANRLSEAETFAGKAAELLKSSELELANAVAAKAAAEQSKSSAETALQEARQKSEAEEEKRKQAENAFNAENSAAAAKPLNFTPNAPPIVIVVKPAPIKLSVNVPNGGQVKRGETLELKTAVTRQNGFAGPVTLTLALPSGIAGLSAEPVVVPADQKEGMLTVHAAADATEGDLKNIVVRAVSDFDGQANVDSPVAIKVVP